MQKKKKKREREKEKHITITGTPRHKPDSGMLRSVLGAKSLDTLHS